MKIEERNEKVTVDDLKQGECFKHDDAYYIVTDEGGSKSTTVVNLATGQIDSVLDETVVIHLDARMVI